jgi:hypothetical protein
VKPRPSLIWDETTGSYMAPDLYRQMYGDVRPVVVWTEVSPSVVEGEEGPAPAGQEERET